MHILSEKLKICCCIGDEITNLFLDELKKCKNVEYDSSIISQLIRIHLDNIGLIEDGPAIRGSWLTPKGEEAYKVLIGNEERSEEQR